MTTDSRDCHHTQRRGLGQPQAHRGELCASLSSAERVCSSRTARSRQPSRCAPSLIPIVKLENAIIDFDPGQGTDEALGPKRQDGARAGVHELHGIVLMNIAFTLRQ